MTPATLARIRRAWREDTEMSRDALGRRFGITSKRLAELCEGLPKASALTITMGTRNKRRA
jgi:hypothetical protein